MVKSTAAAVGKKPPAAIAAKKKGAPRGPRPGSRRYEYYRHNNYDTPPRETKQQQKQQAAEPASEEEEEVTEVTEVTEVAEEEQSASEEEEEQSGSEEQEEQSGSEEDEEPSGSEEEEEQIEADETTVVEEGTESEGEQEETTVVEGETTVIEDGTESEEEEQDEEMSEGDTEVLKNKSHLRRKSHGRKSEDVDMDGSGVTEADSAEEDEEETVDDTTVDDTTVNETIDETTVDDSVNDTTVISEPADEDQEMSSEDADGSEDVAATDEDEEMESSSEESEQEKEKPRPVVALKSTTQTSPGRKKNFKDVLGSNPRGETANKVSKVRTQKDRDFQKFVKDEIKLKKRLESLKKENTKAAEAKIKEILDGRDVKKRPVFDKVDGANLRKLAENWTLNAHGCLVERLQTVRQQTKHYDFTKCLTLPSSADEPRRSKAWRQRVADIKRLVNAGRLSKSQEANASAVAGYYDTWGHPVKPLRGHGVYEEMDERSDGTYWYQGGQIPAHRAQRMKTDDEVWVEPRTDARAFTTTNGSGWDVVEPKEAEEEEGGEGGEEEEPTPVDPSRRGKFMLRALGDDNKPMDQVRPGPPEFVSSGRRDVWNGDPREGFYTFKTNDYNQRPLEITVALRYPPNVSLAINGDPSNKGVASLPDVVVINLVFSTSSTFPVVSQHVIQGLDQRQTYLGPRTPTTLAVKKKDYKMELRELQFCLTYEGQAYTEWRQALFACPSQASFESAQEGMDLTNVSGPPIHCAVHWLMPKSNAYGRLVSFEEWDTMVQAKKKASKQK